MGDAKLRSEYSWNIASPTCQIVSEASDQIFQIERHYSWQDGMQGEEGEKEGVFPVERQPFHAAGLEIFRASRMLV